MITDEELAATIKEKVAELNVLINQATDQDLDVFIYQRRFSEDKTISVTVRLQINL